MATARARLITAAISHLSRRGGTRLITTGNCIRDRSGHLSTHSQQMF
jgi:hypothetical protein